MCHNRFFLVSHLCTGLVERNGQCKQCDGLHSNEHLQKIDARFRNGVYENTNLVYHGMGGLVNIVHRKTQTINLLCLCHLNDLKKLVGKEEAINMHKQILLAISSQQIPCISHVLHVGF
jgi:DnaJ-class molecular chaperone